MTDSHRGGEGGRGTLGLFVVGVVLALAGTAGAACGAAYLYGALAPDNRSNQWRDLGITFGTAGIIIGALPAICGFIMIVVAARRRRRTQRQPRSTAG